MAESNLATQEGNAPSVLEVDGVEHHVFNLEEVPKLVILQQNTINNMEEEKAEKVRNSVGSFFMDVDEEVFNELTILPIGMMAKRRFYSVGDQLLCWSSDMEFPAENVEQPIAATCAECSKGRWTDGVLECNPAKTYMFLNISEDVPEPFSMTFKITGLREFDKFHKRLQTKLKRAANRGKDISNIAIKVTTKLEKGKKGSYYIPVFELVDIEKGEKYKPVVEAYRNLLEEWDTKERSQAQQQSQAETPSETDGDEEGDQPTTEVGETFKV